MLKFEASQHKFQCIVHINIPHRLMIQHAKFFGEIVNRKANLSLGTGIGFSYCMRLVECLWDIYQRTQFLHIFESQGYLQLIFITVIVCSLW